MDRKDKEKENVRKKERKVSRHEDVEEDEEVSGSRRSRYVSISK